jgi:class 3 adenylate cyclase
VNDLSAGAIVFTDIVGFTELTELHGDDAALRLVEAHDRLVHSVLGSRSRVVKELGDGMLLWFDTACDAVTATLELQRRMCGTVVDTLPMWVRVGVHFGTPRRRGDDLIGRDVNLASRIAAVAAPGEVVCSSALVQQLSAESRNAGDALPVSFASLGSVFVKGIAEPVALYRADATPRLQPANLQTR